MEMSLKEFGEKVKYYRLQLGYSQQKLADLMNYTSRSTITKIEKGERDIPLDKIKQLAKILKTTPQQLIGWSETPKEYQDQTPNVEISSLTKNSSVKLVNNIKRIRKSKGITQIQLAEKVGYSDRSTISKIEKGINDMPIDKIREIAKALNVSLSDLLEDKVDNTDIFQTAKNDNIDHYYVDTSMLNSEQELELNIMIRQHTGLLMASGINVTGREKKELIRAITISYLKSLGIIK
ncbi:helix-turn-helix domain-containing protein [Caviibacter abscessus]|uniref:helix-turn-helix domain-containing protein n=1 Tax=Caviibacter abscessus TaxID=1766719 RepID=UPI000837DF7D|nr:helix-turn-helix transcriptional regulator [Caviibacter abscessus]